jgi:TonB family protein
MKKLFLFSLVITWMVTYNHLQAQNYAAATPSAESQKATNNPKKTAVANTSMTPAAFLGGNIALQNYLQSNLKYPTDARANGIQGQAIASFYINAEGQVADIQIEKSLGYGCDEEVRRLLESTQQWQPARLNGILVESKVRVAVNFQLKDY